MAEKCSISGTARSGRWMMVVVGIIIQLCLGAIYAYGAVRGDISGYFKTLMAIADPATKGPSAFDMTWPFITFLALFALTMPLAGPYIQKMGPKKGKYDWWSTLRPWVARGLVCYFAINAHSIVWHYRWIGCRHSLWLSQLQYSAQWFPDKRGLAVGLTVLGLWLLFCLDLICHAIPEISGLPNNEHPAGLWYRIHHHYCSGIYVSEVPAGWLETSWLDPTNSCSRSRTEG